jgi:hypothetical protein
MTPEEAKAMVGTEFVYKYKDGDSIRAYVKKFDPEVGLTCMTLDTETARDGYRENDTEEDGTWCVMGYKFPKRLQPALVALQIIKDTGEYEFGSSGGVASIGQAHCPFM